MDTTSASNPMQRLFRSTITSSDQPIVTELLSNIEKDLASLEKELEGRRQEMDKIRAAIVALENKRSGLKKKFARCRALLSPIHRMPPEILRTIFGFVCEGTYWLETSSSHPVVIVSKICGRWRDIALGMASLWASICFQPSHWTGKFHRLERLMHLFLERSHTSPLKLILDFGDFDLHSDFIPAMDALVHHSGRWRTVEFVGVKDEVIQHPVFHPIKGRLPILSSLKVSREPHDIPAAMEFNCDLFGDCPALSSLELKPNSSLTVGCPLPWGQIRSLTLFDSYARPGLLFLTLVNNIEQLKLDCVGGVHHPGAQHSEEHIVSNIKQLTVMASECSEVTDVMNHITARRLSSLHISGCDESPSTTWKWWEGNCVTDFLERSACTLTSLSLQWVPISDTQIIHLLQNIPTLSKLHIEEYHRGVERKNRIVTKSFLDRLNFDHEQTTALYLPRLSELSIVVHSSDLDRQAILRAVTSRWVPDTVYAAEVGVDCINSVGVVILTGATTDCLGETLSAELRWMAVAGAQVSVSTLVVGDT
ncbi:hypothetical protein VNI00_008763 [Paramarasmius palmivorus]|uniref:F-box domain-containing protein n=1 Tax=Paramarasmius palmivorus TaxID=297713 RepID=A0AAW0CWR5_9AGAR